MAAKRIQIVFSTIAGQPTALSDKERRSHAARVGIERSTNSDSNVDRQSAVKPLKPRKQAVYRLAYQHATARPPRRRVDQNRRFAKATCGEDEDTRLFPVPTILHGNSDPFTQLAIVVTPLVNSVITFMREALYPNLYFNTFFRRMYGDSHGPINVLQESSWLPAQMARQGWHFGRSSLSCEGPALACIASFLNNMAPLLSEQAREETYDKALMLTTKSSQLLRESLDKKPSQPDQGLLHRDPTLITHVYWLFRAAVHSNNRTSATVHGKILAQTMMQGFDDEAVDLLQIIQATIDDVDDAAMHMRLP
jgi:hypothetical protein